MATSLADKPSAPDAEQASPRPPDGESPSAHDAGTAAAQRPCLNCGAAMDPAQDWCLNCGAGAPGSLGTSTGGWRSGVSVLAVAAVLALGAAAAAYAALSKGKSAPHVVTIARAPAPAVPGATPPASATPTTPATPGTPTTIKPAVPGIVKPPKIPLATATPKPTGTTTTPNLGSPTTTPTTSTPAAGENGSPTQAESQPGALLLDTNAAATYNPYAYSPAIFGDPSLTIDGDPSTGWTAQLDPIVAPKMAEGVVIDLKSPRRLGSLTLITSTPGMTIQIYGANGAKLPTSITDHAWVKLSPNMVEKSRRLHLTLRQPKKAFRFVTLWISRAPASAIGTPQAPGHISVNEIELFPAP